MQLHNILKIQRTKKEHTSSSATSTVATTTASTTTVASAPLIDTPTVIPIIPPQPTLTTQIVHMSSGANVYAHTAALTPMATVQLLLIAAVLMVAGIVFVEGGALARAYAWLAGVVGVKEPVSRVSHV